MRASVISALWCAALVAAPAHAAPVPISIRHSGEDQIGNRIAFAVKEEVRRSGLLTLYDGVENPAGWRVVIISLGGPNGDWSAYSIVVTFNVTPTPGNLDLYPEGYVASTVGYCGATSVPDCGRRAFEFVGGAVEAETDAWRDALALWPRAAD